MISKLFSFSFIPIATSKFIYTFWFLGIVLWPLFLRICISIHLYRSCIFSRTRTRLHPFQYHDRYVKSLHTLYYSLETAIHIVCGVTFKDVCWRSFADNNVSKWVKWIKAFRNVYSEKPLTANLFEVGKLKQDRNSHFTSREKSILVSFSTNQTNNSKQDL